MGRNLKEKSLLNWGDWVGKVIDCPVSLETWVQISRTHIKKFWLVSAWVHVPRVPCEETGRRNGRVTHRLQTCLAGTYAQRWTGQSASKKVGGQEWNPRLFWLPYVMSWDARSLVHACPYSHMYADVHHRHMCTSTHLCTHTDHLLSTSSSLPQIHELG